MTKLCQFIKPKHLLCVILQLSDGMGHEAGALTFPIQFKALGGKQMSQESRNNSLRKICINTRHDNMDNETK